MEVTSDLIHHVEMEALMPEYQQCTPGGGKREWKFLLQGQHILELFQNDHETTIERLFHSRSVI